MAHICQVHPYEAAEGLCRSCGGPFCTDCLVYPFGPLKPPFCVPCAVTAGGVRSNARNPTVVVPKETKRQLKEWRKARKRDLDSPPPDGVATWQKMDEAEADAAEDAEDAAAKADAEREALRLPPPVPETPTPPPGVNLAPPGLPGSDWRDEIAVPDADDLRPPWSGFDPDAPSVPAAPTIAGESALGAGWAGADPEASTRIPEDLPAPTPTPTPSLAPTPAPPPTDGLLPESFFGAEPTDTPYGAGMVESDPEPLFGHGGFEPTPFEPDPRDTPLVVEFDADPLASFGLGGGGSAGPLPPPPPAAEGKAFDPLPPPPVVAPLDGGGAPPPPAAPAAAVTPAAGSAVAPPPSSPTTRHVAPAMARPAIRPPTPTRIPAAKPEPPKVNDAKAMLARIAALRSDKSH